MKRFFLNIYRYLNRHRVVLWGTLVLLTLLCVLSALRINFVEDISSFLPKNKENERINYAYEHIGTANKIMVNIRALRQAQCPSAAEPAEAADEDIELLESAADLFAKKMSEADSGQYMQDLLYQIDQEKINELTAFVIDNMPYFFQILANIFPGKWFIIAIKDVMLKGSGFLDIWLCMLILFGMAVVLMLFSITKLDRRR